MEAAVSGEAAFNGGEGRSIMMTINDDLEKFRQARKGPMRFGRTESPAWRPGAGAFSRNRLPKASGARRHRFRAKDQMVPY